MAENVSQDNGYRRRRVNRLKKWILGLLITFILIPNIGTVILLVKVCDLSGRVEELGLQVDQMMQELEEGKAGRESGPTGDADLRGADPEGIKAEESRNAGDGSAEAGLEKQPAHKVYLTFDDGPSIYTDEILDILAEYDVKATFFVVGKEDEASKEALKRIVEEGHTLGMHSYSHKYSELYESVDAFLEDFDRLQAFLYETTGVKSTCYRFPGGSSNTVSAVSMQDLADALRERGVEFYDWNISSGDGTGRKLSEATLVKNSTEDISRYSTVIVLMHDSAEKHATVEALPEIIETIQAMEDTVLLPITEDTDAVQHIHTETNE